VRGIEGCAAVCTAHGGRAVPCRGGWLQCSAGWHRHPETRHLVLISRLASVPCRPAGDNCRSSRAAQVARIMPDNDGGAAGRPPAHNPTPTALVHCTLIKIRNSEPSASPHLHARLAHLSPRIPCLSTRLPVMPG